MDSSIRGLECILDSYYNHIGELLRILAVDGYSFYIPWCLLSNHHEIKHPPNVAVSTNELLQLASATIWELELQIYPAGQAKEDFETYDEFLTSQCQCVLIYYDCGCTELYFKDIAQLQNIWSKLTFIGAENLTLKTDQSDGRTSPHL